MNTSRGTAHPAVATYVSAVRDALGDLPPDELADITDDVRDHVDEVAAELGGDDVSIGALIERLGAPAAYAAEPPISAMSHWVAWSPWRPWPRRCGVLVAAAAVEIVTTPRYEYVEVTGAGNDVGLYSDLGEPVTNIFAYGSDGVLVENVRLYDQAGRPLELGPSEPCYGGAFPEQIFTASNPWGGHVFPRLSVAVDEFGECLDPELQPPFGMALPGAPLK